jgi:hypothetical protein
MNARKTLFVLTLAALAVMAGMQSCQRAPSNTFGLITIPCDSTASEISYTGHPRGTTVIVRVLSYCNGAIIEYQDGRGNWQQPQDRQDDGSVGPIAPMRGYAYALTIPNGRSLRLRCLRGEAQGDSCRFEIIDASQQPSSSHRVVDTLAVDCGSWHSAGFFNFSILPLRVHIHWIDVCKDRDAHHRLVPHAPQVQLRVMGMAPAIVPSGAATLSGNEADWRGTVNSNNELQVQCPGSIPGCRFIVSFIR